MGKWFRVKLTKNQISDSMKWQLNILTINTAVGGDRSPSNFNIFERITDIETLPVSCKKVWSILLKPSPRNFKYFNFKGERWRRTYIAQKINVSFRLEGVSVISVVEVKLTLPSCWPSLASPSPQSGKTSLWEFGIIL